MCLSVTPRMPRHRAESGERTLRTRWSRRRSMTVCAPRIAGATSSLRCRQTRARRASSPPGSRSRSRDSRGCRRRAAAARAANVGERARHPVAEPAGGDQRVHLLDQQPRARRRRTSRCRRSRRRRRPGASVFEMSTTRPRRTGPSSPRRRSGRVVAGRRSAARPRGAPSAGPSSSCGWKSTSQFMTTKPSVSRGRASHSEYRLLVWAKRVFSTKVIRLPTDAADAVGLAADDDDDVVDADRRAALGPAARPASRRRRAAGTWACRRSSPFRRDPCPPRG